MKTLKQKQEEAAERAAAHSQRTVEDQLALIEKRPGNSAGERERLERQKATAKLGKAQ
jgi:hypothetical protein